MQWEKVTSRGIRVYTCPTRAWMRETFRRSMPPFLFACQQGAMPFIQVIHTSVHSTQAFFLCQRQDVFIRFILRPQSVQRSFSWPLLKRMRLLFFILFSGLWDLFPKEMTLTSSLLYILPFHAMMAAQLEKGKIRYLQIRMCSCVFHDQRFDLILKRKFLKSFERKSYWKENNVLCSPKAQPRGFPILGFDTSLEGVPGFHSVSGAVWKSYLMMAREQTLGMESLGILTFISGQCGD